LVSDPLSLTGLRRLRRLESEGWAADLWESRGTPETE
jgi:hypothetical protein